SSGGVCISVGSAWRSQVVDHGILVPGRALWIALQFGDHILGVLSVYAPTRARQRAAFWSQILDVLPSVDSWIIGSV
ncbi:hypothetical protein, partial [Escherichia coli]|uniref:hypothetical protein n=1 Tax=Escherichia coli TaxID=562 RepID=UPI001AD93B9B